jgi:polyphenol oxidase
MAPEPGPGGPEVLASGPVPLAGLPEWEAKGIAAGITWRGAPAEPGWDLGLTTGGRVDQVLDRWRALQRALGFPRMATARQVHGSGVRVHGDGQGAGWLLLDGYDGHATGLPGVLLTVTVADCVPVYLVGPGRRAVALLHAGWRGTAAGVLRAGVETLLEVSGGTAADVVMHCGVAICGSCYEVGSEVFVALGLPMPASGRGGLDLREVLTRQAEGLGLESVSRSTWCSAHHRGAFFSHRGSGGADGRMVAYLGLRS